MTGNFKNLGKVIINQIKEFHWTQNRLNLNKAALGHIILNCQKSKTKKFKKQQKSEDTFMRTPPQKILGRLLNRNFQTTGEWGDILKILKEKKKPSSSRIHTWESSPEVRVG